jgi:hypothetical protein
MRAQLLIAVATLGMASHVASATTIPVSFTLLPGVTGGSPADTGVYVADISGLGLGMINEVTITDHSSTSAGSPGQFSGFDLDAVVISTVSISNAAQVGSLTRAGVFDFAGSLFSPGVQTAPVDPKLFGTTASGTAVDNAVATLDAFDGNSTTAIPGADGFVSLGVGGSLEINLTSPIADTSPLFLYIGEVGNNGEVAASDITVSDTRVPEPASLAVLASGLGAIGLIRRRRV